MSSVEQPGVSAPEFEKVYNVCGTELVVKTMADTPGATRVVSRGRGVRRTKGLSMPRPLLAALSREKLPVDSIDISSSYKLEPRYDIARDTSEALPNDGDIPGTKIMHSLYVNDENNNVVSDIKTEISGKTFKVEDEIEKQATLLQTLTISHRGSVSSSNAESFRTSSSDFEDTKDSTASVNDAENVEKSETNKIRSTVRRVFPMRQLIVINDTLKDDSSIKRPGSQEEVSKTEEPLDESTESKEAALFELEDLEQIAFNLDSYQFVHSEVISLCTSLKKNKQKFKTFFPLRSSRIFNTLSEVSAGLVRGVPSSISNYLRKSGFCAEEDGVRTRGDKNESKSSYTQSGREQNESRRLKSTVHVVNPSHTFRSRSWRDDSGRPGPGSGDFSQSSAWQSQYKKDAYSSEVQPNQRTQTIDIKSRRYSGDQKENITAPDLEKKLKAISQWPMSMLKDFLEKKPMAAVQHLVDCLETDARYIVRQLLSKSRAETHACTCSIGGQNFPAGYGFSADQAKIEAALQVLTNALGMPREKFTFVKQECGAVEDSANVTPLLQPKEELISPERSASPPIRKSLGDKLRMVMMYPTPTLQTYLTDVSDPVASVTYLSQCLEIKPRFMNDIIQNENDTNSHSSIFCIGNMAFVPGFGPDVDSAKKDAALNALKEMKNLKKKKAKDTN